MCVYIYILLICHFQQQRRKKNILFLLPATSCPNPIPDLKHYESIWEAADSDQLV